MALSEAGAALDEGLDDWLTKGNADLVGDKGTYRPKENDTLYEKIEFARNHRSWNPPSEVDKLRKARNGAIHQGIIPSNAKTLSHVQASETALLALYPDMKQAREVSIVVDSRTIFEVPLRRQDAL